MTEETRKVQKPRRTAGLRRVRGPWRVAVVEASMAPAIEPGDWLLESAVTEIGADAELRRAGEHEFRAAKHAKPG